MHSSTNCTDFLLVHARTHPDRCALLHPGGELSYRELDERVWRAAADLKARGIEAGEVVVPLFDDEASHLVVTLALMRLGATVFSQTPGAARRSAFARELERAGATAVIASRPDAFVAVPGAVAVPVPVSVAGAGAVAVPVAGARLVLLEPLRPNPNPGFAAATPIDRSVRSPDPTAPAVLLSGSGTTGSSKLIPIGHRSYRERYATTFAREPVEPDDRVFSQVRFEFDSGRCTVLAALHYGATAVFADRRGASLVEICARTCVTVVWTTVSHLEIELERLPPDAPVPAMPTIRELYVGSSTVGASLRERTRARLSPQLHVRYGANECGRIAIASPAQIAAVPGTVGTPRPKLQVEIVDAQGRRVPPGDVGEVRVRGPVLFDGYADDPQATARALRDGWFHPGDLARWTPDGQLIHCGRVDDMMIMSGINIYPAEIERVLGEHPAVREAVAFPLPSRVEQEIPACAVVLHAGASITGDELSAYGFAMLGAQAPRYVAVVNAFPRTAHGKIDRKALREGILRHLSAIRGQVLQNHTPIRYP